MNIKKLLEKKGSEKIVMLTAFDSITAAIAANSGVDIILVGDSLANTALGQANTLPVTLDEMKHHARAVMRASGDTLVVFDMPFMSYADDIHIAVQRCGNAIKETGCHAVKMEGGEELIPLIKKLLSCGVPVMGHLGLMPQHVNRYGGMYVQGREVADAEDIVATATALYEAGIFALILECVPEKLAEKIAQKLPIPVIGIGAGRRCDGEVQVIADILGMTTNRSPKHAKQYLHFYQDAVDAVARYADEVRTNKFPAQDNIFE